MPRVTHGRCFIGALSYRTAPTRALLCRYASTRSKVFTVAEEVQDAIATGKPVVALETTIYTHGYPYPENVALSSRLESLVRVNGGVPATIGVVDGQAHVGMQPDTLIKLISSAGSKDTWKLSRRDLGFVGGLGLRGTRLNGGTTIAGTMILAHLAGIKVFATGGLGGVHRGGEKSMDISADLTELGRTPVAVISSGCKSFLDIARTIEYLETQGVGVGTFADGRTGQVDFPAFWSRDSGIRSPQTVHDEADAAAIIHAQFSLPVHSGLLLANPVPLHAALEKGQIDSIISQAIAEADQHGATGSANTPYILQRIRELSGGASVAANQALIEANVVRGTKVAVELAKLELQEKGGVLAGVSEPGNGYAIAAATSPSSDNHDANVGPQVNDDIDILVVGSIACDTSCDYQPFQIHANQSEPILKTSNPAQIGQTAGGVGRNVALAAHYAGARVAFISAVGDDIAGNTLLHHVNDLGFTSAQIQKVPSTMNARTAQYVAINDARKNLIIAMADMSIFEHSSLESPGLWSSILQRNNPKWLVLDGNWSAKIAGMIMEAAKENAIPVVFEPVSSAKAGRLFDRANTALSAQSVVPNHVVNLATPNVLELDAMHAAAEQAGFFESEGWWSVVNNFALSSSGSRDKLSSITSSDLVNQGVPQRALRLLPFIPSMIVKLGEQGLLLISLLRHTDQRLTEPDSAPFIVSRNFSETSPIGGVYMRLFGPAERVKEDDIVSVNGVGDTMLGVLMAHMAKMPTDQQRLEDAVPLAQKAAVMTLKSREAVSHEVRLLL